MVLSLVAGTRTEYFGLYTVYGNTGSLQLIMRSCQVFRISPKRNTFVLHFRSEHHENEQTADKHETAGLTQHISCHRRAQYQDACRYFLRCHFGSLSCQENPWHQVTNARVLARAAGLSNGQTVLKQCLEALPVFTSHPYSGWTIRHEATPDFSNGFSSCSWQPWPVFYVYFFFISGYRNVKEILLLTLDYNTQNICDTTEQRL